MCKCEQSQKHGLHHWYLELILRPRVDGVSLTGPREPHLKIFQKLEVPHQVLGSALPPLQKPAGLWDQSRKFSTGVATLLTAEVVSLEDEAAAAGAILSALALGTSHHVGVGRKLRWPRDHVELFLS